MLSSTAPEIYRYIITYTHRAGNVTRDEAGNIIAVPVCTMISVVLSALKSTKPDTVPRTLLSRT